MRKRILSPDELILSQSGNAGGALLTTPEAEEQHRNVFRLLWRRKWGIIAVTLLCLGGAFVYLHRMPWTFTSMARVYVQQPDAGPAGEAGQVSNADSYLYLQSELVKSEDLLKPVSQMPEIAHLPSLAAEYDPVRALQNSLDVELDNHLDLIIIKYSSRSPAEAVLVGNAILNQYCSTHDDPMSANSSSKEVVEVIATEQEAQRKKLEEANEEIKKYRLDNPKLTFSSADKGNIVVDKLMRLSEDLTSAQLKAVNAKAEYEQVLSLKGTPSLWRYIQEHPVVNDVDVIQVGALASEVSQRTLDLEEKSRRLAANHPDIVDARAMLAVVEQQLENQRDAASASYVDTKKQDFDDAARLSDALSVEYEHQQDLAKDQSVSQTNYDVLMENASRQQKLCEAIDARMNELKAKQVEEVLNINVLQRADKEHLEISPHVYRVIGMAGVMGLVLGMVCAFLLDMADGRIHTVEEVRSSLGMRVLGAIPHVRGAHLVTNLGRGVDLYPAAEIAEAFRIVRTAIHLKMQARRTRPILITSPQQGEGKTVVSSNLAIAMAKSGRRTILVDADMRSPMMHCIHTVSNARGLFNVLCGELNVSQAVLPSGIDRLDIMPAGPTPPNPAELLNDIRFNQLVKDLCAAYDAVIIDAPPVMPVADPAIISAWCKTTILVMRARKSNLKDGQESLDRLAAAGASVLGVVVNDVPQRHGQYGYYGSASAPRPRRALPTVTTTTKPSTTGSGPQRVELIDPDGAVSYAEDAQDENSNDGKADSNSNGHPAVAVAVDSNGNGDGNGVSH
jgi:polysaccharide biosynthesis transport protein